MLGALLPPQLDNGGYRGRRLGPWLFRLVAAPKGTQSLAILSDGRSTAKGADGIPLDAFSPDAAQTVISVFAQGSLWRRFFCLLCGIVLLRYRSAVPLMFALLALNSVAAQVAFAASRPGRTGGLNPSAPCPTERVDERPGPSLRVPWTRAARAERACLALEP